MSESRVIGQRGAPGQLWILAGCNNSTKLVLGRSQWPVLYQHRCLVVKVRGSRVTSGVFVWSWWKNSSCGRPARALRAAVSDRSVNAQKHRRLCFYITDFRLVPRFDQMSPNTTKHFAVLLLFWMETVCCRWCLNAVIGRWGALRKRCDVVLKLQRFFTSAEAQILA